MPAKSSSTVTSSKKSSTPRPRRRKADSNDQDETGSATMEDQRNNTAAETSDGSETKTPAKKPRKSRAKSKVNATPAGEADDFGAGLNEGPTDSGTGDSAADADVRPARPRRKAATRTRAAATRSRKSTDSSPKNASRTSADDSSSPPDPSLRDRSAENTPTSSAAPTDERSSSTGSTPDAATPAAPEDSPRSDALPRGKENSELTDTHEMAPAVSQHEGSRQNNSNNNSQNRSPRGADEQPADRSKRRRRRRRRGGSGDDSQPNRGGGGRGGNRQNNPGGRQQGQGQGQQRNRNGSNSSRRTRSHSVVNDEVTGTVEGVLELHPKEYGFLRDPKRDYAAQDSDAFVSSSFIQKHALRAGVLIRGDVGPGSKGQGPRLKSIETIDGRTLEEYKEIANFDELTPVNPFEQIKLETGPRPVTMRVMDLLTPIGKGQRALIVAPPRTGKTMLLHDIAHAVSTNHPEMTLIVLLIDERPEEVTEIRRNVNGEVIASSMDRDVESHVRLSQLIVERGKRLAEAGQEVFILLDSITRTARAFNKWIGNSGRTGTGGLDVKAMDIPRKIFGTARRFDEGGSLTILATALIDTGSRMDEAIFQEFKGTGNMELILSRDLADRRIWPAIDVSRSGTRREEKILDEPTLDVVTLLRRSLVSLSPTEAMEELTRKLEMFPTNAEFLQKIRNVL